MLRAPIIIFAATASLTLSAGALAQNATPAQTAPSSTALDQVPSEVRQTRLLNTGIVQRNLEAERQEQADAKAFTAAQSRYEADLAQSEVAQRQHEADLHARTAAQAESQALYERRMDDWRATVAACERGDHARCAAGKAQERPSPDQ
ncbi:hypothetical protein [Brevundimonas vesicularis]|uniref:hypothetical protein n=1 Tax=Brevundimonas vesicularis TaxID=41276 RepID=UPI0038D3A4EC